ncbi:MAG TPA: 1-deoxy-D-xylulose-5-phosphate synthase [Anaerohalosphaeraceae bacterium]|nr:1-deoxy-D-xylulose-5-phosphate synthase [Phycisphaerae bacterium]HOL30900.1 1-deoxy-D-xylulose-5-phosphate synthase [Anaerohalosphaeraceae bacterium]HOM76034.1 1-deoxy-D-xylulose-5-phosphate synthase [Anaerohalosphaeraceae bacterium]HPC64216.1 1-deoxy-D-xylulose-5-phosphate synthase [Anaerohalosphaeraceae bacterium]HPO68816.1 1-deoxy-D-xylulose-5-phosphate synthase [Anaerohalosphaeraceae bacterium]
MSTLLETIQGPQDLRRLSMEQLNHLAAEIRELITQTVSQTGGHLASNLGIVDLTIAMHRVFNFRRDRLLWDVGHQCYAHKILTGRKELFGRLRQENGLSGFPSPEESEYDVFSVGHAGTSIATALGMALGAMHNGTDEKIVALVGDASIVNGLSFEALNNVSLVKRQMLIVLNDNSMAIDVTQGAMAAFLSRVRLSHTYEDIRKTTNRILEHLPLVGRPMEEALENLKKTLRMANTPSRLFESMNIAYFGPVDGHDIGSLIDLFEALSELNTPAILHVYTRKGKGYLPADDNPRKYHSTGPFEVNGSGSQAESEQRTFTSAFGEALVEMAAGDRRIVAITAAMPDGTGLVPFREKFPQRYYDVGIAESAAVDIAAGLAKQGLRPVVCIYSTFLQRSFDQIFQEASLQNLPVIFCVDRAGAVGSDGPTHHGFLDVGCLRMLPNLTVAAPADEMELKAALQAAVAGNGPFAVRYPRDAVQSIPENNAPYQVGKSAVVRQGDSDFVVVTLGPILQEALQAADMLEKEGLSITVVNARFAKPIDSSLEVWFEQGKTVIFAEDSNRACGFGSAVIERMLQTAGDNSPIRQAVGKAILLGAPDGFLPVASRRRQLEWMGLTAAQLARTILTLSGSAAKTAETSI